MLAEMEELRAENHQLRKDLDCAMTDREHSLTQCDQMEEDNRLLEEKIRIQNQHFAEENRKFYALESSLKQDGETTRKQYDAVKSDCVKREADVRSLTRELDNMRSKLEKAMRRNAQQKDVEAFHEIEMLKSERKDLLYDRDETTKLNKKLANEIKKLESSLEEKVSELRNENRRHSLLTKEFNSLLEENNHLKLQLRRRRQGSNTLGGKDEASTESTTIDLSSNVSQVTQTRRFNYTTSLSRDTSPLSSADTVTVPKLQRERTLVSRDRMRSNRERSSARSDGSYHSAPTQNIAVRESEHDFSRDRQADNRGLIKLRSTGSRSDSDSSPPPESLPNISGGRTWRP